MVRAIAWPVNCLLGEVRRRHRRHPRGGQRGRSLDIRERGTPASPSGLRRHPDQIQDFMQKYTSVGAAVDQLLSFKPSKAKPPKPKNDDDGILKMQRWWLSKMIGASTAQRRVPGEARPLLAQPPGERRLEAAGLQLHVRPERPLPAARARQLPDAGARVQPRPRQPLLPRRHHQRRRATTACT